MAHRLPRGDGPEGLAIVVVVLMLVTVALLTACARTLGFG